MSPFTFQNFVCRYRDPPPYFQILEVVNMRQLHLLVITFHFLLAANKFPVCNNRTSWPRIQMWYLGVTHNSHAEMDLSRNTLELFLFIACPLNYCKKTS